MAIAVDASSPARVSASGGTSVTTGSFNPPACVLVACLIGDTPGPSTVNPTIAFSNNGTALTWTEVGRRAISDAGATHGFAAAAVAVLASGRTGMTVTVTLSGASGPRSPSLKVYCLTGVDAADVLGGYAEGSTTTNSFNTTAITSETAGMLFAVGNDWNALGTPQASSDLTQDTYHNASYGSGLSGYKQIGSAGASVTGNLNAAGTSAADWNWIAFEVRAAGGGASAATLSATAAAATATLALDAGPPPAAAAALAATAAAATASLALDANAPPPSAATLAATTAAATAGLALDADPPPPSAATLAATAGDATATLALDAAGPTPSAATLSATAAAATAALALDAAGPGASALALAATTADASAALALDHDTLADGLLAWWELGESSGTRADSHGSNDLTAVGSPGSAAGKVGDAVSLDGSTQYLTRSALSLGTAYTFGAWIRLTSTSGTSGILCQRSTSAASPVSGRLTVVDGQLRWSVRDDDGPLVQATAEGVTADAWHFCVGVRDGDDVSIYLDGVAGTPASATIGTITPTDLDLGAIHAGSTTRANFAAGRIDQAFVYDRALRASEVAALFNGAAGRSYASVTGGGAITLAATTAAATAALALDAADPGAAALALAATTAAATAALALDAGPPAPSAATLSATAGAATAALQLDANAPGASAATLAATAADAAATLALAFVGAPSAATLAATAGDAAATLALDVAAPGESAATLSAATAAATAALQLDAEAPPPSAATLAATAGAATATLALDAAGPPPSAATLAATCGVATAALALDADAPAGTTPLALAATTADASAALVVESIARYEVRAILYDLLSADPGLAALVGTRIRPGWLRQGDALPALTFTIISVARGRLLAEGGAATASLARVQFDCWGEDPSDTAAIAAALADLLHGYRGEPSPGVVIHSIRQLDEHDRPEPPADGSGDWVERVTADYSIHYKAALPDR